MQHAAATPTWRRSGSLCKITVECEEQLVEFGICQQDLVQGTPPSSLKVETTMANTGRNDPCPCGSGKKYKRCCLDKDEAAEREVLASRLTPALGSPWQRSPEILAEMREALAAVSVDDDEDELTAASNAAADLVNAGKLDEAEKAARDLLERFPEVHDGYDRLGMVYEARGDKKQAAYYYRKVIEVIQAHAKDYDPEFEAVFHKLVAELDPTTPSDR
jgi:hypothetical protein